MRYNKYSESFHWKLYKIKGHWYKVVVDKSLEYLKELGTILDIGSGDGLVDRLLIDKGFKVIGIEPEHDGNLIAQEKVPEMRIIESTLEEAELPEVDYLYSLNTIEHCQKPERFIEAMKKVRKFGIVITDNSELVPKDVYHEREFTLKILKDLFKDFKTEELVLNNYSIGLKIWRN